MSLDGNVHPDSLNVICLTQGYILTFQGASYAVERSEDVGPLTVQLLNAHNTGRQQAVREQGPTAIRDPAKMSPARLAQPVPSPSQGATRPPADVEAPIPVAQPLVNITASQQNLKNLVARRLRGEIKNDAEFYVWAAQYCPGIDEGEIMDALDESMTSYTGNTEGADDGSVVGITRLTADLVDLTPQQMIDDFIVDDATGQKLSM